MKTFIIIFETSDIAKRKTLDEKLRTYPRWAIITEFAWVITVQQDKTAANLRDELACVLNGTSDRLMVVLSGKVAAWKNTRCRSEWLKENL